MLIGLVRRIGTDGFDFGTDEDYHSGTAKQDALVTKPICTVTSLITSWDYQVSGKHCERMCKTGQTDVFLLLTLKPTAGFRVCMAKYLDQEWRNI